MTTATDRSSFARLATALLALQLAWPAATHAAPRPPRLQYSETLSARWQAPAADPAARSTGTGRSTLRFDAFGRPFDLELTRNDRFAHAPAGYAVHKGVVASMPRSWARITQRGRALIGIFFDGREYFGIEPVENVLEFLDPDAPVPPGDNLVFRFADLLIDPEGLACGLDDETGPVTAAAAMTALTDEMNTPEMAAAIGPTRRVSLAPVADLEFATLYGTSAETEVMARLNVVEGIFTEQVGVEIVAEPATVFNAATPSYTLTSTNAPTLLDQISDYRLSIQEQAGLTHLFTGKRLNGNLVGIAWQGAVCLDREGAGLSTSSGQTAMLSALIAAHEIGHNFGAPHDGESGSACASTPTTFLMAANVTGSSTFSSCSLTQMAQQISARAASFPACLVQLYDFDASVTAPSTGSVAISTDLDIVVTVRNLGTQVIEDARLMITTPAALAIVSVIPEAGACTTATNRADCTVTDLAPESEWRATWRLRSDQPGTYDVTTSVAAAGDQQASNDSASTRVTVTDPNAQSSGGGGGMLDGLAALVLLLAAALRAASTHGSMLNWKEGPG